MNKSYLLTEVHHVASVGGSYTDGVGGDASSSYSNRFVCIPHAVPYRPRRMTPKPVIQGVQTAVVVGPSGEEIWVDKYGRVKVQFHWDREGKRDEKSSCWIRVSQNWAGKRWGAMFIPRIGQEVIVSFLEGDPDQPFITGSVYNAEQVVPYDLPKEQTKSTMKSDSSKGHGGFNELRFEDKKGGEQIFLHAQKDMDLRVKNDAREWIGKDRHLIVKGKQKELVEGDKHLNVKMNHSEKVGQVLSIKAGQKVVIEAGMEISLKAAGGFIDIGPAGIYISGTMVYINSGGSAGSPTDPEAPDVADDGTKGGKM
jgi:type VI secretion system secreted protein VgrG